MFNGYLFFVYLYTGELLGLCAIFDVVIGINDLFFQKTVYTCVLFVILWLRQMLLTFSKQQVILLHSL